MKKNIFQGIIQSLAAIRFNSWWLSKVLYRVDPKILKWSKGKYTLTTILTGLPIVILRVKGGKSGIERRTPLVSIFYEDKIILIASYFGNPKHPSWYFNIKANPDVIVEYQGEKKSYKASVVTGDEREKYWNVAEDYYVGYKNYKKWAGDRIIPVIVLEESN